MYLYVLGPHDGKTSEVPLADLPGQSGSYQPWSDITVNGSEFQQMVWNPEPGIDVHDVPDYQL